MKTGRGVPMAAVVALVLGAVVAGLPAAADAASSLEPLLEAADIRKVGLQGVVLSPPDACDRIEQMGFETSSYLGGMAFAFRKGKAAFRMMSGIDMANNGRAFLTKDQFAALARVVRSRL